MRLALCLEDLGCADPGQRYTACVAMPSGAPGLSLGADGGPCWRAPDGPLVHLGSTEDGRLALWADPARDPAPVVSRGGRRLACPAQRPVILLDGDELELAAKRWRVHVHGPVGEDQPTAAPFRVRFGALAAGLAAVVTAAGCASSPERPTLPENQGAPVVSPDDPGPVMPPAPPEDEAGEKSKKNTPPVEVRDLPPYKPAPLRGRDPGKE